MIFKLNTLTTLTFFAVLCLFMVGCDGDDNNSGSSGGDTAQDSGTDISGTWTGSVSGYGETVTIVMNIIQNGSDLSGTYTLTNNGDSESGNFTGTYSNGTGDIQFFFEGQPVVTGDFTFNGDNATATLHYETYSLDINLTRTS